VRQSLPTQTARPLRAPRTTRRATPHAHSYLDVHAAVGGPARGSLHEGALLALKPDVLDARRARRALHLVHGALS
jgi:hypothetical protein